MVPKEFEHLRRTGRSRRPAGPPLMDGHGKPGFFILLRWLIGFFLPQLQGFLHVNYKFSPCDGVVCVGHRMDPYQTLSNDIIIIIIIINIKFINYNYP